MMENLTNKEILEDLKLIFKELKKREVSFLFFVNNIDSDHMEEFGHAENLTYLDILRIYLDLLIMLDEYKDGNCPEKIKEQIYKLLEINKANGIFRLIEKKKLL